MGDEQIPVVRLCQRKKMDDQQIPQDRADKETEQHGCFDFMTSCKDDKTEHLVQTDATKDSKEEKHTLMDDLHAHSTSSSDEEVEEGGERKKKKKKGLKEAIIEAKEGEEKTELKDTRVPMEQCGEEENAETEEKKSFLDKIKEKLPGQHKKAEEEAQCPAAGEHSPGSETKEKKGIIDKIKEKLHKNNENDAEKK